MVADAGKSGYMTAADKVSKCNQAVAKLQEFWNSLNRAYYLFIVDAASSVANTQNTSLQKSLPVFSSIIRGVSNSISELPPSGAVAGIYALVDRTRGVWKAPANVSLNNVIEPTQTYTKSQLDNLNVDVYAGKSINAIRTFFGKGTLVYGARTLAGNDNEWRYISVRRLFVMVEESVKKATEQFVFEPNDSNTWVKVQAMIENFLYNIWRQGALQGIKPEHAFYVAVGLNKTMNPIDILEGRMIIEIGMAAVRPAEFIILRFSHKMAES
jgi:phage tail sheath protein FI